MNSTQNIDTAVFAPLMLAVCTSAWWQVVKFELWKDKAKASILRAAARRQAKRGQRVHLPTKVLIT